jgi:metal-responsive CopG/Arc/MetJ family transcriptional regulator
MIKYPRMVTFRINDELFEELFDVTEYEEVSHSDYIRQAVESALNDRKKD